MTHRGPCQALTFCDSVTFLPHYISCQILNTELQTTAEAPRDSVIVRDQKTDRQQAGGSLALPKCLRSQSPACAQCSSVCTWWWSRIILKVKCFTSQRNVNISRVRLHPLIVCIIISGIKIRGRQQWATNAPVWYKIRMYSCVFLGIPSVPSVPYFSYDWLPRQTSDFWFALVRAIFYWLVCWHCAPQCCDADQLA